MPKSIPPTQELDEERAGASSPPMSTDTAAEEQPPTIDAADQSLNAIDDDLAELEALFATTAASASPEGAEVEPAASSESGGPAEVRSEADKQEPISHPRIRKESASGQSGHPVVACDDDFEAPAPLDADGLGSGDDAAESIIKKTPSHDPESGTSASSLDSACWNRPGLLGCFGRLSGFACRAGLQILTFLLAVVDRPFRHLSMRVKTLLGYVAWATLFVAMGTWIYALWIA